MAVVLVCPARRGNLVLQENPAAQESQEPPCKVLLVDLVSWAPLVSEECLDHKARQEDLENLAKWAWPVRQARQAHPV